MYILFYAALQIYMTYVYTRKYVTNKRGKLYSCLLFPSFSNTVNKKFYTGSVNHFKTSFGIITKNIFKVEGFDYNEIHSLVKKRLRWQSVSLYRLKISLSARSQSMCVSMHTDAYIQTHFNA